MFTAIVFVLTSGCAWRYLPPSFGVTVPTAHRRFTEWTKAGLRRRLHRAVLDELGSQGLIDWSRAVLDGASVRAKKDIPCAWKSSSGSGFGVMRPGGRLVVEGPGCQATMQNPHESVGQLAQRAGVPGTSCAELVVVGPRAG